MRMGERVLDDNDDARDARRLARGAAPFNFVPGTHASRNLTPVVSAITFENAAAAETSGAFATPGASMLKKRPFRPL